MCSPYAGRFIKPAIRRSSFSGDLSSRKPSTSASVGGRPVRSRYTRRTNVSGLANGAGFRPSPARRRCRNASIGFATSLAALGTTGFFGAMNAQCSSYLAPCSTHALRMVFSSALRVFFESGGGIRSSASSVIIRCHASLSSRLPGTIAAAPFLGFNALAASSNRSLPFRVSASCPWHEKQFAAKIFRTSRLYCTVSAAKDANGSQASRKIAQKFIPQSSRTTRFRARKTDARTRYF